MGNQTSARSQDMKTLVLLTIVAFACATPAMERNRKQRQGIARDTEDRIAINNREGLHRKKRQVHQDIDRIQPKIAGSPTTDLHRKKRQIHQEIEMDPKIARPRAMELQRKKGQDYYYYE